jgi:ureidoglycolate dehydrogenase (NAD+)
MDTPDYPRDSSQEVLVPADALREFLAKLYVRKGMFKAEAEVGAQRQVDADLRGIHSHGCAATMRYLKAMDTGDIDPRGQTTTVTKTPAIAVLDGGQALGHVTSTKAMQLAIEMAREVGTGTVAVRNSQHYGAASVYALMAAKAGMIGYSTTSTGTATVAAYGSKKPATANNAFAWAAPVREGAPFCLDMACAVSSWGKVHCMLLYGGTIPQGWALDAEGRPTSNPSTAKVLLPAAGARGYGLAILSSILAGPLAGGKMPLHKTWTPEKDGSEHFFYAVDVSKFVEMETFYTELETTLADIRALPPVDGVEHVRIPGQLEWERAEEWSKSGIPLHREHLKELAEEAAKGKIPVPW